METAQEKARLAATQVFDDVSCVKFVGVGEHEEAKFEAHLRSSPENPAIITINPNGIRAVVEWRNRRQSGYRVLKLEGAIG